MVFSELRVNKQLVLLRVSELRTKQQLEIQCFRDFVFLGQIKRCFLVFFVCFRSWGQKTICFTVFSELRTKQTLEILCFRDFVALGQINRCF